MNGPKHFSMLREFHLADFFTLANAACGVAGVFFAMRYTGTRVLNDFLFAAAFAPAAFARTPVAVALVPWALAWLPEAVAD